MKFFFSNVLVAIVSISFLSYAYSADEEINPINTEINFFTGVFDWSDSKTAAGVIGLEHQNDELFVKSNRGVISPITGGWVNSKNGLYLYTGIQAEYQVGFLTITPSFAPGYYNAGSGKDLGYPLEFKTELQMSFDLGETTSLGMSYNHLSHAHLGGDKNPGANSYMFNFLKNF